jgi:hypothetical protein
MAQYQLEQAYQQQGPPTPKPTPSNMPSYAGKPYTPPAPKSVTSELGKKRGEMSEDKDWHMVDDRSASPSQEGTEPAPTRHAPEDADGRVKEKSKYEASDVYRSRKGDRFS